MDQKKIIFITGATGGMGKATAVALANMGHNIVIHGRDDSKTEAIVQEIRSATGNDHIDHLTGDLYLMSDVKKIADAFMAKYDRLDVLINNVRGDGQAEVTHTGRF